MTRRNLARLTKLEQAQHDDDVPMTVGVRIVNPDGTTHRIIPPQPIPDWDNPRRRVDYRRAIWEGEGGDA